MNLFPEKNPDDAIFPFTYYPGPGLTRLAALPFAAPARGLYRSNAAQGDLYYVAGASVYYVAPNWTLTQVGTIGAGSTPVSMADNGIDLMLADGTVNKYSINLASRAFSGSIDPNYSGAVRLDFLDTFIVGNIPASRTFFSTLSNALTLDPTYLANKEGFADLLATLAVVRREIWLIGQKTTEIWFDAGGAAFPFQIMPGPFIQHGCVAPWSLAAVNGALFWLSQDQAGQNILARGEGYQVKRISTHAMEVAMSRYPTTADAVGFCFQQNGHSFYQITFPAADKTWRWDEATEQLHEVAWTDNDGVDHRHRAQWGAFAYGKNVVADWETGTLYALDPNAYDDAGQPIVWRRGFPHLVSEGDRVSYKAFAVAAQCGTATGDAAPDVTLRISDDAGQTWRALPTQTLGAKGEYLTQLQWQRLGMARDRVFELSGTVPGGDFALSGAFVDAAPFGT